MDKGALYDDGDVSISHRPSKEGYILGVGCMSTVFPKGNLNEVAYAELADIEGIFDRIDPAIMKHARKIGYSPGDLGFICAQAKLVEQERLLAEVRMPLRKFLE